MKTLKALTITTLIGAAALVSTGCSNAQKGAAAGGLAGGIGGATVANAVMAAPATGAAVGGAGGVAVGGLAGDAYDQITEKDVERELENLRAEVQKKDEEIAMLRETGDPAAKQELETAQARLAELEGSLTRAVTVSDQAEKDRTALTEQVKALQTEADNLRDFLAKAEADKAQRDAQLASLRKDADALRAATTEKEAALAELRAAHERKESALNDAFTKIQQKESALSEAETRAREKEAALKSLEGEVGVLRTSLNGKEKAVEELRGEMDKLNVKLDETSRGLTLTIVDSLLFDAGQGELSKEGKTLIGDVAKVLKEKFPGRELAVEGHTDNQPIVRSGWKSNWELGAARALSILHELTAGQGIDASLVSATSFGEFRPATTNATPEGRAENRRAVIVILPEKLPLQRTSLAKAE